MEDTARSTPTTMTSTRTYVARRKMRIFFAASKKYLHTSVLYGTREQKFSQCSPGLSEGAAKRYLRA